MKFLITLSFIFLSLSIAKAENITEEYEKGFCNGEQFKTIPEERFMVECDKKYMPEINKLTDKELKDLISKKYQPGIGCSTICTAKALGIITEEGKVILDKLTDLLKKMLPNSDGVIKALIAGSEICLNMADPNLLYKQESCEKDSDELLKIMDCLTASLRKECGIE